MNRLICELESIYNQSRISAKLNKEKNRLSLKQRIMTEGEFLSLDIYVNSGTNDIQKYQFLCYGLGLNKRPTEEDMEKIRKFNEKNTEISLSIDESGEYILAFERTFHNIDAYAIGVGTLDEAMKCVTSFQVFIKSNYYELKHIIKGLG